MSSTSTTPIPQACESTITSMSLLDLTASSNASASTLRQQPQSPPSTMSMRAPQQRRLIFHELRLPPPRGPIRLRDLDPINLPRFHLTQPRRPQRLRLTPPRRSLGDLDPDNLPRFRLTQPRRPQRLRLTPPRRPKSLRLTPPRRPQVLRLTPPTRPQRLRLTMPQRIVAEDGQEITMEDIPQYSEHNLRPGETHDPVCSSSLISFLYSLYHFRRHIITRFHLISYPQIELFISLFFAFYSHPPHNTLSSLHTSFTLSSSPTS